MHGQASGATVDGYKALTEKEKQTLRLLLAGHDAKSAARQLDLSVHTINERLREARRKLSVSSSKEAARLLRDREGASPETLAYERLGDGEPVRSHHPPDQPGEVPPTPRRAGRAIGGLAVMFIATVAAAALALLAPAQTPTAGGETAAATQSGAAKAARDWLALGDAGNWDAGWAATTPSFQALNTVAVWRSVSQKVRAPLGPVVSRTLIGEQDVPAPPNGYRTVQFRTTFAHKRGAIETVSLEHDGDAWKVAGVYIE